MRSRRRSLQRLIGGLAFGVALASAAALASEGLRCEPTTLTQDAGHTRERPHPSTHVAHARMLQRGESSLAR
jgi:hypothetical protein